MTTANYAASSPIDIRLPLSPEADSNPQLQTELTKVYNAIRNLQLATTNLTGAAQQVQSIWPLLRPQDTLKAQNLNRIYVKASEVIANGAAINFWSNAGVLAVRNANASTPQLCHGICTTAGGIASGAVGELMVMNGLCTNISGLTIGATYYLSNTPGIISSSPGTTTQVLGFALGPQLLYLAAKLN